MILGAISSTDKKDLRSAIHPDTIKYLLDMGIEVILKVELEMGLARLTVNSRKLVLKANHDMTVLVHLIFCFLQEN